MSKAQERARAANWTARNIAGWSSQLQRLRGTLLTEEDNADLAIAADALQRIEGRRVRPFLLVSEALTKDLQTTHEIAKAAGVSVPVAYRVLRKLFAVNAAEWWKRDKGTNKGAAWMVVRD